MSKRSYLSNQKIAVGAFVALAAAVLVYLLTLVIQDAPLGEFIAGEHYVLVENPRRIRGEKIQVTEIFSYACVHCYDLDPDLTTWVQEHGEKVDFVRIPALTNDIWRSLARSYYAMEALGILDENHLRTFHEIHDKGSNLANRERFADFIEGHGTTRDKFLATYDSNLVDSKMQTAEELQRRYKVSATPTLAVNGKYLVQPTRQVGMSRILDVVDHLINREIAERSGAAKIGK